jgi:uncharacterized membrane protein (DUF106 family)
MKYLDFNQPRQLLLYSTAEYNFWCILQKILRRVADVINMESLTSPMLLVFVIAGAITTLAMLSVFANVIQHETQLHDLRNRVKELQYNHAMYIARLSGAIPEEGEVEILSDSEEAEISINNQMDAQGLSKSSSPTIQNQAPNQANDQVQAQAA